MNEPTTPLKLDARTVLEAISATLAFLLAGIAAVDLPGPYDVLAPLAVGALIVMIMKLLGKSATDAVAEVKALLVKALTKNTVLEADASVATLRKAEEAVAALDPPKP